MRSPGGPGQGGGWGPGRKQAFGTAASQVSHVWFTVVNGNIGEVFHPTLARPLLKGVRFAVAASGSPPIQDDLESDHDVRWMEPGVPSFRVESKHDEYRLTTEYVTDPARDGLLISGNFQPEMPDLRLYLVLEPHELADAEVVEDDPEFMAARMGDVWVVLVGPFSLCSIGYTGVSDLVTGLKDNDGRPGPTYHGAEQGWITLGAELGLVGGPFLIALGFGGDRGSAEETAREAMRKGSVQAQLEFSAGWRALPGPAPNVLKVAGDGGNLALASMTLLRCLEDKTSRGGFIAAPSAPWGDPEQAYNRIWNRDMGHIAGALLDAGDPLPAQRALDFFVAHQRADGSWPQSYQLDGTSVWSGTELDQAAFPILLAWRLGVAGALDVDVYPDLVRRAGAWICRTGPSTPLDRWEDAGGYSPSSLAAAISALVVAAAFADEAGDAAAAYHFGLVADYWNERIEGWTYLASFRHYVRLGQDPDLGPAPDQPIGLEFLELSRRGLRRPDDPRLASSLITADVLLEVGLPGGRCWRRYSGDAYGETVEGLPWPHGGAGRGRPWPLLIGERAHQAVAQGQSPADLIRAMEYCAGPELVLPEQVWDGDDVPQQGLVLGRATGSASPLGWAHAEYLSLLSAFATQQFPDAPEPVRRRYASGSGLAPAYVWHERHPFRSFPVGRLVKLQLEERGSITCSVDDWAGHQDLEARGTGLGLWVVDLPTAELGAGRSIQWRSRNAGGEEGPIHRITAE
ncbi:MAG TPA: glycoside hydrolase family 15 protein [Candidatus Acidoferrales bacterium]|nr:glycoside hydrolase family 15 protein [Candidatus Acidoferrales bacterium]